MLPYRDDNPTILTPFVTLGIIALNVAAWVLIQGAGVEPALSRSVCELGLIPGELLHHLPVGASVPVGEGISCTLGTASTWYTPLTSMFLHGSWGHILGNMWFFWVFGNNVEDAMGHSRFLAFYLLCGLAAVSAQVLATPDSAIPMVGASGAISGIMGAYVMLYPRVRVHMITLLVIFPFTFTLPAYLLLGYWFLLQILGGSLAPGDSGGVAFWAHTGGFLAGAVLIRLFQKPELMVRHQMLRMSE